MIRHPVELPLHRDQAYFAVVVGQALQVFGIRDYADPYEVERLAGCQEGDLLHDLEAYISLLHAGLRLCEFTTYRAELMAREGAHYLRKAFVRWTPELEAHYTPENVSFYQYMAQRFVATVQSLPAGHYGRILRPLDKMDVLAALGRSQAVLLQVRQTNGRLQPVLVTPPTGADENIVGWAYDPGNSGTATRLQLNALWARHDPTASAVLISR